MAVFVCFLFLFFFNIFILAHFVLFMFVHWSVCKLPGEGAWVPFQIGLEA